MTRPEVRIGDQERSAAAAALGEHFTEGRLDREEYDERTEAVWSAKTSSDLAPLFADLPASRSATAKPAAPVRTAPRNGARGGWRVPLLPVILIVVGLTLAIPGRPWWLLLIGVFVFNRIMWTRYGGGHRWAQHWGQHPGHSGPHSGHH